MVSEFAVVKDLNAFILRHIYICSRIETHLGVLVH